VARSEPAPLTPHQAKAAWGRSMQGVINSITKVHVARCLAKPWGRNEDCRACSIGSVLQAGGYAGVCSWAGLLCSALLHSFASLVL
jgi:hypothetical protein